MYLRYELVKNLRGKWELRRYYMPDEYSVIGRFDDEQIKALKHCHIALKNAKV